MAKQITDNPKEATTSDYDRVVRLMNQEISVNELENLIGTNRLDYNKVMYGGKTFFFEICKYVGSNKSIEGLNFLKRILEEGKVNIDHKDANGNTVLLDETKLGHIEVCEILIDNRADIDSKNKCGDTPLRDACLSNNFEMTLFLLNKGAKETVLNPPLAALKKPSNCYGKLQELETLCQSKLGVEVVGSRYESVPGLYFIEKLLPDREGLKECLSMQEFNELFEQAKDCRIIKHFLSNIREIFEKCTALKTVSACPPQDQLAEESFLKSFELVNQEIDDSSFVLIGGDASQQQDQELY